MTKDTFNPGAGPLCPLQRFGGLSGKWVAHRNWEIGGTCARRGTVPFYKMTRPATVSCKVWATVGTSYSNHRHGPQSSEKLIVTSCYMHCTAEWVLKRGIHFPLKLLVTVSRYRRYKSTWNAPQSLPTEILNCRTRH